MAEAKITLALSPREFDLLRDTLRNQISAERELRVDNSEPSEKKRSREREAELASLLDKLK